MAVSGSAPLMSAIRVHRFGASKQLTEERVPWPQPQEGQVLVRVHAAGVGPWDALVRTGRSGIPQPLPLIPGSEVAGIVTSVGPGVADLSPGDAVYGATNPRFTGGYAEYCVAHSGMLAPKPVTLDFIHAAAVPVVAVTAWQMLFEYGHLHAGQKVLVHGAAGGVGSCAVQLAHRARARVVGTASVSDVARLEKLGADQVVDYRDQRFEDVVHDVDLVIDTVGGETQQRSFAVLREGGTLVSSVAQPAGHEASHRAVTTAYFIVEVTRERLLRITQCIDSGQLTVDVGDVLELRDARLAHEMLGGAPHRHGKIVLRVHPIE